MSEEIQRPVDENPLPPGDRDFPGPVDNPHAQEYIDWANSVGLTLAEAGRQTAQSMGELGDAVGRALSKAQLEDVERVKVAQDAVAMLEQFRVANPDADDMIANARRVSAYRHQLTHQVANGWAWPRRSIDCEGCRTMIDPAVWRSMVFANQVAELLGAPA